jgi:hypothetical protein
MAINLEEARKLLPEVRKELMRKPNVVATGVGYKVVNGEQTKNLALICSVDTKKSKASLSAKELIPASIQNIPTDVYATGIISALIDGKSRIRPAPGGVSIGHKDITAGTLGCLVKKDNKIFILSNNHVLANSNNASIGDFILQPGPADGGRYSQDHIANLSEFIPIVFEDEDSACSIAKAAAAIINGLGFITGSKTRLRSIRKQVAENLVDCAIAEPVEPDDVNNEIVDIGAISGLGEANLDMEIQKSGRTTEYTTGRISQIDVTSKVSYGPNKLATFVNQLMAGAMSQGGDSGSAVLSMDKKLVGLLFAGSTSTTVINPIQYVFNALNITLP